MSKPVKRRTYDSSARQAQSEQTRNAILDAARRTIISKGYRSATVTEIALDAGVHVDTLYELVGRKPVILRELIERAISGSDHAITAEDRDYVKAIRAEPDPARKLAIYAAAVTSTQTRMAPLFLALRDAAGTDAEAADVWTAISDRRARNMRDFVRDVEAAAGGLRPGLSVAEAADTIWATNSAELYTMLTRDRRWSNAHYERWLADTWRRLLLPD